LRTAILTAVGEVDIAELADVAIIVNMIGAQLFFNTVDEVGVDFFGQNRLMMTKLTTT